MKKYLLLLFFAASVFAGCSKSHNVTPPSSIVGKWNITADTDKAYTNGSLTATNILPESVSPYIQFDKQGTGSIMDDGTGNGAVLKFSFTVQDNSITFAYPTQTVNGVTFNAFIQTATYKTFSSTSMELIFNTSGTSNNQTITNYEVMYIAL